MSKLDKLIQQLCPDGVEYKSLGEVCNSISDGSHNPPKGVGESSYIMISSQNIQPNGLSFDNVRYLTMEDFEKENKRTNVSFGDVLLTIVGTIGRSYVVKENDPKLTLQRSVAILHPSKKINSYFLHYYLLEINSILNRLANGAAQKGIYLNQLSNIEIPLPLLPVQEEIVRILETFTSSISNLKEQIKERRKQYEYYRNLLLDLEGKEGVEMKTLGEICDTLSGFPFDSSLFSDEGVRLMRGMNVKRGYFEFNNELNKYWSSSKGLEKFLLKENDIIISMDGSLVGRSFCYVTKDILPLLLVQRVARLRTNGNYKYIYHNISKSFPTYVDKKKTAGAIPHISMKDINNFIIPFPSLIEQERIVNILDQFEASIANLEAQLKEREKQYEYYRNQLLDFKKKEK